MFSEGNAAHPVGCEGRVWQPSAENNGRLAHFKFEKSVPNGNYYLQSNTQPDHSAE
jgi:hypothetical protein